MIRKIITPLILSFMLLLSACGPAASVPVANQPVALEAPASNPESITQMVDGMEITLQNKPGTNDYWSDILYRRDLDQYWRYSVTNGQITGIDVTGPQNGTNFDRRYRLTQAQLICSQLGYQGKVPVDLFTYDCPSVGSEPIQPLIITASFYGLTVRFTDSSPKVYFIPSEMATVMVWPVGDAFDKGPLMSGQITDPNGLARQAQSACAGQGNAGEIQLNGVYFDCGPLIGNSFQDPVYTTFYEGVSVFLTMQTPLKAYYIPGKDLPATVSHVNGTFPVVEQQGVDPAYVHAKVMRAKEMCGKTGYVGQYSDNEWFYDCPGLRNVSFDLGPVTQTGSFGGIGVSATENQPPKTYYDPTTKSFAKVTLTGGQLNIDASVNDSVAVMNFPGMVSQAQSACQARGNTGEETVNGIVFTCTSIQGVSFEPVERAADYTNGLFTARVVDLQTKTYFAPATAEAPAHYVRVFARGEYLVFEQITNPAIDHAGWLTKAQNECSLNPNLVESVQQFVSYDCIAIIGSSISN